MKWLRTSENYSALGIAERRTVNGPLTCIVRLNTSRSLNHGEEWTR
ncbi:MAG: hypothetical protein ACTS40_01860 [Candidatus Hodgkinia cicadicola]